MTNVSEKFSAKRVALWTGALLLTGTIVVPMCAYVVGVTVIGPYAGNGGLLGYLAAIWRGIGAGDAAALSIALAPTLLTLTWWITVWARRKLAAAH